jgi:hypothetical protein
MRYLILCVVCSIVPTALMAQSVVGKWQLVNQTSCLDEELEEDAAMNALVSDMQGRGTITRHVISFKDNNTGEETTRALSKKKIYNPKSFLYKFNGESLFILDKKSRTILEIYTVEKITADSLVISNSTRACETKLFVKINP